MGRFKDEMVRTTDPDQKCAHCDVKKLTGSDYCAAHGGWRAHDKHKRTVARLYRTQHDVASFADHQQANTFREEIGVLRLLLQKTLDNCQDDHDLLLRSQQINQLVNSISSAVTGVTRLEQTLGKLLSEDQAHEFLTALVEIISSHVTDPLTLEAIARDCYDAFSRISGQAGVQQAHLQASEC